MKNRFENISLKLEKDILDFSNLFLEFKLIFDNKLDTLKESILSQKLSNEAKSLLLDLKNCQSRVDRDIQKINNLLTNPNYDISKKEWFNTNRNLTDFLDTSNNVFEEYNKFLRKDIKILKETFEKLTESIKTLNEKIKEYNQKADLKFIEVTNRFDLLNQVVNLGYNITKLEKISFEEFKEIYKEADKSFLNYLKFLNDNLENREEWKWLDLLEKYFDIFNDNNFKDVLYK